MSLLLVKSLATIATVLGLTAVAERAGPMLAGILAGVPMGLAIIFLFFGLEEGPEFVVRAAPFALGGLAATLVSNLAFWFCSSRVPRYRLAASLVGSIGGFLSAALLIAELRLLVWSGTLLVLALAVISMLVLRPVAVSGAVTRVRQTWLVVSLRAAFAVAVVLAVTEGAGFLGTRWSGLLAGFPVTLFPVLVIVQVQYTAEDAYTIIKGFPYGIPSLVIFAICAHALFVPFGVAAGFILSLAAALAWQALFFVLRRRIASRRGRS